MSLPLYRTRDCDCTAPRGVGFPRPDRCEEHGNRFQTDKELEPPKERAALARVSEKRQAEYDSGERRNTGSTLKPGRGFAVAPAQRAKMKLLVCLGCGREVDPDVMGEWMIDPAHLLPRSAGGCDDPLCVAPLCRHLYIPETGCHWAYDHEELDLLPRLARGGYEAELAHMVGPVHGLTPTELVRRLAGEPYVPRRELEVAQARIVELEMHIHA